MAYKDSSEIATNSNYALGDYSFRNERSSVPGSSNDKIEAICTDKDGKNARKSIQVQSSTQMDGWYVEANDTEATVYAMIATIGGGSGGTLLKPGDVIGQDGLGRQVVVVAAGGSSPVYLVGITMCSLSGFSVSWATVPSGGSGMFMITSPTSYKGASFYVGTFNNAPADIEGAFNCLFSYGDPEPVMVGRFAIDLEDAGGVGPGSDWIDPGDYDPDWEPDDPTHTLYVTVTGALSGRHNDPIVDPSYSYIPADKDTVKDYGCGGDGGHGGGGGAGASTVVVHKFATNQANSKEVIAVARRHGYGSGGGKGGKGGDGCILVYY